MPEIPRHDRGARRRLIKRSKKAKDPNTAFRFLMIAKLEAWRAGLRDARLPAGTWPMRVQHFARCAECG